MDTTHRNSPEENYKDLKAAEGIKKIKEMAEQARTCFMCTNSANGQSAGVRPMGIARADEEGTLWFISANDSNKNREIAADPQVKLYFHGDQDADFLYVKGTATISEDKALIKKLWQPPMKVWFTEGEDDPHLSAIQFTPDTGYYWTTKHGKAAFIIKSLIGVAMGKTLDDSIQGEISM